MTEDLWPLVAAEPRPEAARGAQAWFLAAVGIGLVAGWLELGAVLARQAIDPRITMDSLRTNRHQVWMIPVSDVLIFGTVGLLIALFSLYRPGFTRRRTWRLYVALAALALLLAIEELHPIASVVLACGIAAQVGPMIESRAARLGRLARFGLPVLAGGLVVLTGLTFARVSTSERRALSRLPAASPRAPNVLLIVLDNVRAASMSLYGRERPTTPNLERLARQGIRFAETYATASWTLPSHASMFTGRWAHELCFGWDRALDATYPTLAEALAARGYATAGFVGNTYYGCARYGLNRGFARYEDYYENQAISFFEVLRSSGLGKRVIQLLGFPIRVEDGRTSLRKTAEMLNRDVLGWLDDRPRERPFFVFLNYFDAHSPFVPPDGPDPRFGLCALSRHDQVEILKRYLRLTTGAGAPGDGDPERIRREATDVWLDSYESCIAYLDRQVGRLFAELDRRGLREDTLVIVTSDHGEHFQEHGFLGHGLSLYRREVQVPLLIFPPSATTPGRTVAEPVSLRDLPATIVDVLGLGGASPFPGESLARYWRTTATEARRSPGPLLAEVRQQKRFSADSNIPVALGTVRSVVSDGKVYIRNDNGREELYDRSGDPLETDNLINASSLHPPAEHFRELLERSLKSP